MTIDSSKLNIGDAVTIHARIEGFFPSTSPFPVMARIGLENDEKRDLFVIRYDEIATHGSDDPSAIKTGDKVTWSDRPEETFEFLAERGGRAILWDDKHRGFVEAAPEALLRAPD